MHALYPGDPRSRPLAGGLEIDAILGIDLGDGFLLAAGGPHRVVGPADGDVLTGCLGREDAFRLVGLPDPPGV